MFSTRFPSCQTDLIRHSTRKIVAKILLTILISKHCLVLSSCLKLEVDKCEHSGTEHVNKFPLLCLLSALSHITYLWAEARDFWRCDLPEEPRSCLAGPRWLQCQGRGIQGPSPRIPDIKTHELVKNRLWAQRLCQYGVHHPLGRYESRH